MGRMLEALNQSGASPRPPSGSGRVVPPAPVNPDSDAVPFVSLDEDDSGMPFIEVGPSRSVEGSPEVLAAGSRHVPVPMPPVEAKDQPVSRVLPLSEKPDTASAREDRPVSSGTPLGVGRPHRTAAFRPVPPPTPRGVMFRPLPAEGAEDPTDLAPEIVAYYDPSHKVSQEYRELLASLTAAAPGVRTPALLFTAAASGAGTTTALLNVAVTAAAKGRRTVVVDANLRRPAVADRLGIEGRPGLRELLSGGATLEEAVVPTRQANLSAVCAGGSAAGSVRFPADSLRSLFRQLRQRFDLVLIDGPCWDGRPEVAALGTACDAAYLVTAEAESESAAVDELLRIIPGQGVRLAGCVVAGAFGS